MRLQPCPLDGVFQGVVQALWLIVQLTPLGRIMLPILIGVSQYDLVLRLALQRKKPGL
jgi:hypothetical protein